MLGRVLAASCCLTLLAFGVARAAAPEKLESQGIWTQVWEMAYFCDGTTTDVRTTTRHCDDGSEAVEVQICVSVSRGPRYSCNTITTCDVVSSTECPSIDEQPG